MTLMQKSRSEAPTAALAATFDRLLELSGKALEAVEAGEFERLDRLMLERETLVSQAPLSRRADDPDLTPESRKALLEAALRLRKADERLSLAVASRRDEIGKHLEAIDDGEAARSAYVGKAGHRSTSINVLR